MKASHSPGPSDSEPEVQHTFKGKVVWDSKLSTPETLDTDKGGRANRLAAAKQLQWRGAGNLPQLPWAPPDATGLYLFIELWSGIGTAAIAMLAMGLRLIAVGAEHDQDARDACRASMPSMMHYKKVENVNAVDFSALLARRGFKAIILGVVALVKEIRRSIPLGKG